MVILVLLLLLGMGSYVTNVYGLSLPFRVGSTRVLPGSEWIEEVDRSSLASNDIQDAMSKTRSLRSLNKLLPSAYPSDYIPYQVWNNIQDACSFIRNIFSLTSLFKLLGVGDPAETALNASIVWILRDGAGMLAGLLFAASSSSKINQNVKSWRFFADLINNIGITLEVIAPLFGKRLFLLVISISSIFKALCGHAAGSSNAAIISHFGEQFGNTAEISGKNNAQHTCISLLCLLVSLCFSKLAKSRAIIVPNYMTITSFVFLTLMHVYSNTRALGAIQFKELNIIRLEMLGKYFLELKGKGKGVGMSSMDNCSTKTVEAITPALLATWNEPLIAPLLSNRHTQTPGVHYYASPSLLHKRRIPSQVTASAYKEYSNREYFVVSYQNEHFCCFTGQESVTDRIKGMLDVLYRASLNEQGQELDQYSISHLLSFVDMATEEMLVLIKRLGLRANELLVPPDAKCYRSVMT